MIEVTKDPEKNIYTLKIPFETKDDYGNKATLYRKEEVMPNQLEAIKANLEAQLAVIDEKLDAINQEKDKK